MEKPTISNSYAVTQAGMTIEQYHNQAVRILDNSFGKGYAQKHPELLSSYVNSQALDFNYCLISSALWEISESLRKEEDF